MFPLRLQLRLVLCAVVTAATALPAAAQWAWRDANGRTVYSDQPPPPGVKKDQILRQPGGGVLMAPAPATAPGAAPSAATGSAPADAGKGGSRAAKDSGPKTLAEREQDFRKRQQERAESEQKQAAEQAQAQRRQQECERQRGYLRALEDGVRIGRTDAQGNREILDDAQRNAEVARVRESLRSNCN